MEVREWQDVRDEMIGKAETFLDGLGLDVNSVVRALRDLGGFMEDDECGQTVIEDALSIGLGITCVTVDGDVAQLWIAEFQLNAELPLPLPIKEFIRGWNEGILQ